MGGARKRESFFFLFILEVRFKIFFLVTHETRNAHQNGCARKRNKSYTNMKQNEGRERPTLLKRNILETNTAVSWELRRVLLQRWVVLQPSMR